MQIPRSRLMELVLACLLVCIVPAQIALARVQPDGVEFRISPVTGYVDVAPDVATLGRDSYVVVWSHWVRETNSADSVGRRFGPRGTSGGQIFLVTTPNPDPDVQKEAADVTALIGGRIASAWTVLEQDGDEEGVFARVVDLDAGNVPVTPELLVNTYTTGCQFMQTVAALSDGSFVVSWVQTYELFCFGPRTILAQRFDQNGQRLGSEIEIPESGTQFVPTVPEVKGRAQGGFVVAWTGQLDYYGRRTQDGDGTGTLTRIFDAAGDPVTGEFVVNSYTTGDEILPDLALNPDDSMVVTWVSRDLVAGNQTIHGQKLNGAGSRIGTEFVVTDYASAYPSAPDVDAADDGSFVVVWRSRGQDGDGFGVIARRFAADAQPDGSEFVVNTYTTGDQGRSSSRDSFNVAMLSDTSFVVVWDDRGRTGQESAVFGQRFCVLADGECGDTSCPAVGSTGLTASDALEVLRAAVGSVICPNCVCDANGSLSVTATDALLVLQNAVGTSVVLACPLCSSAP